MTREELHALVAAERLAQGLPPYIEDDEPSTPPLPCCSPRPSGRWATVRRRGRGRPGKGALQSYTAPTASPAYCRDRELVDLYGEALDLLADRLAWHARRGEVLPWAVCRTWFEVLIAWWRGWPR